MSITVQEHFAAATYLYKKAHYITVFFSTSFSTFPSTIDVFRLSVLFSILLLGLFVLLHALYIHFFCRERILYLVLCVLYMHLSCYHTDVYMYFTLNFYLCTTFCLILLNGIAQLVRLKPSFILWLICLTAPFPVVVAKWRQTCQTKRWQPSQGKTNVFARFSSSCVRAHKPTYAKCLLPIMTGGETFRPLQWNLYDDDILIT